MPRPCTTCKHPNRDAIEAAMSSGTPFRNLAQQFQVSASSIFRHKAHALESPKAPVAESGAIIPESPELTLKMRKFCLAFTGEADGNGTQAARLAGYQGNDVTLAAVASENLRKPQIQAFIRQLRANAESKASGKILSATEVLAGLTRIAQADPADVFEADGTLDLQKAKERGVSHLIKSVNFDKDTGKVTKVELYNSQTAFVDIGRHHKLFTDKVESNLSADAQRQIDALREIARGVEEKFGITPDRTAEIMRDVCPEDLYPSLYPSVDVTSKVVS